MKKIRDFLPKEVLMRIDDEVKEILEEVCPDSDLIDANMERLQWIWEQKTVEELEGVKVKFRKLLDDHLGSPVCGVCDKSLWSDEANFCLHCGTKVDWSGDNE